MSLKIKKPIIKEDNDSIESFGAKSVLFWGSNNSGKSVIATLLAKKLAENNKNKNIVLVYTDEITPIMNCFFPTNSFDILESLGILFTPIKITSNLLFENITTLKKYSNLGLLGFKNCENYAQYPECTEDLAKQLIDILKKEFDYVIIDGSSTFIYNQLTSTSFNEVDVCLKLCTQTLKSASYFGSNEAFLETVNIKMKKMFILTGFNYEQLVSGKYKLMLEPVGYPKIAGKVTACTATEIAILDKKMNGDIRKSAIQLFSHLNLPMAMYLERDEFGIKAYKGSTVSKQSNDTIIAQLGVGAITFKDFEEPPPPPVASYVYRTNTEVYTSLQLSGIDWLLYYKDQEIKNPVNVTFNIGGRTYPAINRDIIFPSTGIAYVKWRTPDKPQDMIIKAKVSYKKIDFNQITGSPYIKNQVDEHDIAVKIVELKENPPPNPDADDRNDSFRISKAPKIADDMKENRWYEYSVTKEKEPVYNDKGEWKYDREAWIWTTYEYTAKLGVFLNTYPDPLCKTYRAENWNTYRNSKAKLNKKRVLYKMKSGYGIRQKIETRLLVEKRTTVTHLNGDVEDYTQVVSSVGVAPQNAINYFSDFDFKNYFRLSEVTELRRNESILEFKKNRYSTYDNRTHFTPIWYPDNEFYVVNSMVFDAWTPAGQLYLGATTSSGADVKEKGEGNAIFIKGNLWDDWYVQPLPTYGTDPREI